jgi:hypothetical protein
MKIICTVRRLCHPALVEVLLTPHWLLRVLRLASTRTLYATPMQLGSHVWVNDVTGRCVDDDTHAAIQAALELHRETIEAEVKAFDVVRKLYRAGWSDRTN